MRLADYGVYPAADDLVKRLGEYDLHENASELAAYGLTVVPPEKTGASPDFIERLRDAILRVVERRNGVKIDDYRTASISRAAAFENSWDLLEEDDVFAEAAVNPPMLVLVRWLLGQSAVFSGQTWIIKQKGDPTLGLHSDSHGIPPGAGNIAHMCNASWLCTDYEGEEDGPTVFVPGSHHFARATLPHEAALESTSFKRVPLIAKVGSIAIWNGATWHASSARTKPGLRVTLVQNYMRPYMRVQKAYTHLAPELLGKFPEMARLTRTPLYPYEDPRNPDPEAVTPFMKAGLGPFF